jgi:Mn-containing catalase
MTLPLLFEHYGPQGNPWTADYLKITGELDVTCAATSLPKRAQRSSMRLINFCDDAGTKDALQFLMTRETTHMKAFAAALESMKKPAFSTGFVTEVDHATSTPGGRLSQSNTLSQDHRSELKIVSHHNWNIEPKESPFVARGEPPHEPEEKSAVGTGYEAASQGSLPFLLAAAQDDLIRSRRRGRTLVRHFLMVSR